MRRPRLSYANVISTLALFIALTGTTAFAASKLAPKSVGEPQLRPVAVTADKLRTNAVTAPKIKAQAVKQGKLANGSVTAAKMTQGSVASSSPITGFATNAESASPPAFAAISSEATIDSSFSKSIAAVKEGSLVGIYCVSAAGFTPRGAQVTPRFNGEGDVTAYVRVGGTADCPAPGVEVQTFDGGMRTKEPFYLALYR